jgi:hypothetical protein
VLDVQEPYDVVHIATALHGFSQGVQTASIETGNLLDRMPRLGRKDGFCSGQTDVSSRLAHRTTHFGTVDDRPSAPQHKRKRNVHEAVLAVVTFSSTCRPCIVVRDEIGHSNEQHGVFRVAVLVAFVTTVNPQFLPPTISTESPSASPIGRSQLSCMSRKAHI